MQIKSSILITILLVLLVYQITGYCISRYNGTPYDKWEISLSLEETKTLKIGDTVELFGGYFQNSPDSYEGEIIDFILGKDKEKAVVVRLKKSITGDSLTGNILVMELRYEEQTWSTTGPVNLELCDFKPVNRSWKQRRKGERVEAGASFRIKPNEIQKAG